MRFFRFVSVIALSAILFPSPAFSLTPNELGVLRETVREMCLYPSLASSYIKATGEAHLGAAVPVKVVKGELKGTISYESWTGIPLVLDKYKTDPRQCAVETLRLLLPTFSSEVPKQNKSIDVIEVDFRAVEHELTALYLSVGEMSANLNFLQKTLDERAASVAKLQEAFSMGTIEPSKVRQAEDYIEMYRQKDVRLQGTIEAGRMSVAGDKKRIEHLENILLRK